MEFRISLKTAVSSRSPLHTAACVPSGAGTRHRLSSSCLVAQHPAREGEDFI